MFLTEAKLSSLLESCQQSGDFSSLKQNLWDVTEELLMRGSSTLVSIVHIKQKETIKFCNIRHSLTAMEVMWCVSFAIKSFREVQI